MKIIYLTRTSKGGILSHIKTLVNMTDRSQYTPVVIGDLSPEAEDYFKSKNVKCYNMKLNGNLLKTASQLFKLVGILKSEKPDLVHIHSYIASIIGRTACAFAGISKVVVTLHNYMPDKPILMKIYAFLEKVFAKRTKVYIAVSQGLKGYFTQQLKVPEGKIQLVYNGIEKDVKPFDEEPKTTKHRIISISRLTEVKGAKYYVSAAIKVLQKRDDVEFLVAGEGPLMEELKEKVKAANYQDKIVFLGFRNDIYKYLKSADIFALVSFAEGLPISIIEAMRFKKPIIASRIDGNIEEVFDGYNGLLVEPGNDDQIVDAVMKMLDDEEFTQKCGENGYELFRKEFSSEGMYAKTKKIYDEVMEK